jgi:hypothetical protein
MRYEYSVDIKTQHPYEVLSRSILDKHRLGSMPYQYDDGGRTEAGYKGSTGDCVCRAISIAANLPYRDVYDALNQSAHAERITKRRQRKSNARTGVHRTTVRKYLVSLGWTWVPTMTIGSGCKVHLRPDELPPGRIIVKVSKHLAAVVDGVLHDTHDCSRDGTRCVYGYYMRDVTAEQIANADIEHAFGARI